MDLTGKELSGLRSESMHIAKRVQRKRVRGWRMPANTVYVGRPTRWGNPYKPSRYADPKGCLIDYKHWLKGKLFEDGSFLDSLIGRDLACWCRLDQPCHADVLLEFLKREVVGVE